MKNLTTLIALRRLRIAASAAGVACALALSLSAQPPPPASPESARPRPGPRPDPATALAPIDPNNAGTAVALAQQAASNLTVGSVWTHTGPAGDGAVEATLLYQNRVVARLRFSSLDGSLQTLGAPPALRDGPSAIRPGAPPAPGAGPDGAATPPTPPDPGFAAAPSNQLAHVRQTLPGIIQTLRVLPGAEVNAREGDWRVPLARDHRIVAELAVSADGRQIVEDFGAARDSAIFAR